MRISQNDMHSSIIKKIPGGKLLRVDIDYVNTIDEIQITGDFFLHPEDALLAIEKGLQGIELPFNPKMAEQIIRNQLEYQQATVVGFSPADLAAVIAEALP